MKLIKMCLETKNHNPWSLTETKQNNEKLKKNIIILVTLPKKNFISFIYFY